ncbi:MAG: hypothetical protein WBP16_06775 [Ferruginibacter sp.]
MTHATKNSWKHLPAPAKNEPLAFEGVFNDDEIEKLRNGLVPEAMEDKWFIYYADGWLFFHRSWTGALIYSLRLEGSPAGARVVESWVNREPEQYAGADIGYDRKLVRFLIDAFLLRKQAVFPMPPSSNGSVSGVIQHSYVGRAYPESPQHENDKASDA